MKELHSKIISAFTLLMMLLCGLRTLAQDSSLKTAVHLAPGVTHPIGKDTTSGANPQMITSCDGNDIRIFPSPNPQSEIHLSINKVNPNVLLLSSQTFPVANSWQGAYWSTNGGTTWVGSDHLPNNAPGRGDPSTAFDAAGNGYVSTMSYVLGNTDNPPNGYLLQRTANNGTAWQPQVSGSGIINGFDKPMIAADDIAASPNANNFYCAWTNFNVSGRIEFNRSTNLGATFSVPIYLSAGVGQGANVQTGTNGEVYVCWSDYAGNALHDYSAKGLGFCRSVNGGVNFTSDQRVISYTGIRAYNTITGHEENPLFGGTRVNDFPAMAVDKSNGVRRGRIYVVAPVKENGNGKAIIQISWSDNQGTTWSLPKTVSIANGRQNWFPWITVDATNGNIYVIYYSLDAANGFSTNTYVAISNDAGATFINQRVSDAAHITAPIMEFQQGYAGDYIGITSHSGRAYAAWCDNRTGQWQDYVSQVSNSDITGSDFFCNGSTTYSVTNIPNNSSVTWTINPSSGIVNLSQSNNQATLTKVANGAVTLTATIANACGATSLVLSKTITIGNPTPTGTSSYSSNCSSNHFNVLNTSLSTICTANTIIYFNYNIVDSRFSNFVWTPVSIPAGATWYGNGANLNMSVTTPTSQGQNTETIALSATGPCGVYNVNFTSSATYVGSFNFTIAPNPSQDNVIVSSGNQTLSKSISQNLIYAIKITDHFGTLRKSFEYKSGITTIRISLTELNSGIYLISVFDGNKWSSKQLVIQK